MSRMDRYYKNDYTSNKRTSRNQDLYKSIYEDTEYSNIEGIADIDRSNEIDIAKIKDMLRSREDYQSGRELKSFIPKEEPVKYETFEREEDRVYDIRDILTQAKTNKTEEKYHNLDQKNLDILKELRNKSEQPVKELENMVDTITNTSKLNKLSDNELGLDMLEDLKSDHTITTTNSSIKAILEEAKQQEKEKTKTDVGLDKSFFTSSLSFTDDDFAQIGELKRNIKANNNLIKIVLIIIMLALTAIIGVLVFNVLK